jgi:hypothetical protein
MDPCFAWIFEDVKCTCGDEAGGRQMPSWPDRPTPTEDCDRPIKNPRGHAPHRGFFRETRCPAKFSLVLSTFGPRHSPPRQLSRRGDPYALRLMPYALRRMPAPCSTLHAPCFCTCPPRRKALKADLLPFPLSTFTFHRGFQPQSLATEASLPRVPFLDLPRNYRSTVLPNHRSYALFSP